ncbi:MAG TPA: DUF1080 domain-containing protein [Candidatus Glassbacteria bacterium]|nr:DUF1080 domain-containing protein [Candidatus Glassbacteria bacterium]
MPFAIFKRISLALCLSLALSVASIFAQSGSKSMGSDAKMGGSLELLSKNDSGKYSKKGWNHYGPGHFTLDEDAGVLTAHGGMGLFWYSPQMFGDFELELDFMCDQDDTNSGIFVRVPYVPTSDDYIYDCFEIQIYDAALAEGKQHVMHEGAAPMDPTMKHATGAIYDAKQPTKLASLGPNKWNHYKITCKGSNYKIELNGVVVNDWDVQPAGKVKSFSPKGYVGLQNHEGGGSVHFRNIRVKEL